MAQKKNTRLVYIDKKNLDAYAELDPEDFKEFFMAYFTYHIGDDMRDCFSNKYVYNLFSTHYQEKIDFNEAKWQNKADANRENGKKGGRPLKGETAEEARVRRMKEFEEKKQQEIEPNLDFENEVLEQSSNTPIETPQQNFYTTPPPESSQGLEDPPLMDFMGNQCFMGETYNSFINNNVI